MEVHAYVRSARPRLALVFSALVLAAVLVLAHWQVAEETSLQDPVTLPGTEISFRPPNGWVATKGEPGAYDLLMPEREIPIKRLRLRFLPRGSQYPIPNSGRLKKSHLGRLPAVEKNTQIQRGNLLYSMVERVARTPRHEILALTLESRARLNLGDFDMLDAVANSVSFGSAELMMTSQDLLKRIGIEAKVPADWQAAAAWSPEIPGGFLTAPTSSNQTWTIELTRTFMTADDSPEEILTAAALTLWPVPDESFLELESMSVDDLRYLRATTTVSLQHNLVEIWLVYAGPREMLLATAALDDTRTNAATPSPLSTLLDNITFHNPYPDVPLRELVQQGKTLAEMLAQRGPAPWWGREPEEIVLLDRETGPQAYIEQHDAVQGDPDNGYFGQSIHSSPYGEYQRLWQSTPDSSYSVTHKRYAIGPLGTRQLRRQIEEHYDHATSRITRQRIEPASESREWPVPDNYVAQPIDTLAHYQVAIGQSPDCIVALSDTLTPGVHACYLQRLEPGPDGQHRVLEQCAHTPNGLIYTFGESARLYAVESSTFSFKQSARQTAQRLLPNLRHLPELKTIQQTRR